MPKKSSVTSLYSSVELFVVNCAAVDTLSCCFATSVTNFTDFCCSFWIIEIGLGNFAVQMCDFTDFCCSFWIIEIDLGNFAVQMCVV